MLNFLAAKQAAHRHHTHTHAHTHTPVFIFLSPSLLGNKLNPIGDVVLRQSK